MLTIKNPALTLIFVLLLASSTQATNFTVSSIGDSGPNTLRQAIEDANADNSATALSPHYIDFAITDTIKLSSPLPDIMNDITIDGSSSLFSVIISGENQHRILYIYQGSVTLIKLTFVKGKINTGLSSGAAIYNENGICIINECNFNKNIAEASNAHAGQGGAIFNENSCTITNSVFYQNKAFASADGYYGEGAAIYSKFGVDNGVLEITDCSFIENEVKGNGDFQANGGAIFMESGTLTINGSIFSNNKNTSTSLITGGNGGAIFNYLADCFISGSNFTDNSIETGSGGAIYNVNGPIVIENSVFTKNTTSGFTGGAIHNELGICKIVNSEFSENSATNNSGGAVFNLGKITISNSSFNKNTCSGLFAPSGGAIYSSGMEDSIMACAFENNISQGIGGALYVGQYTALINSTFTHNFAKQYSGGAIYTVGTLMMSHCTFFGNVASNSGGAIYSHFNGNLFMDNTIVAGDSIISNGENLDKYTDVYGVVNSQYGHNIFGNTSGLTLLGVTTGNLYNVPAEKIINVKLENNGGFTSTHSLINCSVAINAGENTPYDLLEDQRGQVYLDRPDIGAYESDGTIPSSPEKPLVVLPTSYCSTESINELEAIGSNIKWYSKYPATLIYSGDKFTPGLMNGDSLFYVTQTDVNNCESHPAIVPLVIEQAPPMILSQESATICPGSSTSFTVSGSATREVIRFDGEGDFVEVGVVNSSFPILDESYTIEAWVFAHNMGTQGIVGWGNYETNNQINALKLHENGIQHDWGGNSLIINTDDIDNTWHHIATTYDGTTRRLYLDGGFIGSDIPGMAHEVPSSQLLQIGNTNYSEFFSGDITEVRIWNTARTTEEIQTNMNHKIDPTSPNLIGYWRGYVSENRILDVTGNNNDGYLFGDASSAKINLPADYLWTPGTGLDITSGNTINASPLTTTVYTVTASFNKWICTTSKEVTVNTDGVCSGTTKALSGTLQFNPNPTEGIVTLKVDGSHVGDYNCTVKDVAGKTVYTSNVTMISGQDNQLLNLTGLPSGIYFLTISNKANSATGKLVIK